MRSSTPVRPAAPRPVQLPAQLEPLGSFDLEEIGHRSELEAVELGDADLTHRDLRDSSWQGVSGRGARLSSSDLAGSFLTDVRLIDADLANLAGRSASWQRLEVRGGRGLGLSLSEAMLRDVVFDGTQLDLAGMRFATLQRVVFRGCRMHEVDLSSATLQSVLLEDCDLTGADVSRASFERCELRGCSLEGVRGLHDLSGIAMSLLDVIDVAPLFARACGVHVLEDE